MHVRISLHTVLYQMYDDGIEHPVAFMSRKLNSAQRNYNVTELECLAAVLSVKKFRAYVEGMPFKIVTDHASLKWLMGQKDLSGRLARWSLKLQSFDFEMAYVKGSANVVPDALSRAFVEELDGSHLGAATIDLLSPEFQSAEYGELKEVIKANQDRLSDLKVVEPHVFRRSRIDSFETTSESPEWKLWVPKTFCTSLVISNHDSPSSAHRGYNKTLQKIKYHCYWPGMTTDVRK